MDHAQNSNCKISIKAPAKINLYLAIGDRLPNGYHAITTIMQAVTLFDNVTVELTENPAIQVACNELTLPTDEKNIAFRAAADFFGMTKIKSCGCKIYIEKKIPHQAGLGGGSSDAAAVLKALDTLLDTKIPQIHLQKLAAKLGADVPFFISGKTSLATGIGEILEPIPTLPLCYIVIVKPDFGIQTKLAFEAFDKMQIPKSPPKEPIINALLSSNLEAVCKNLHNDFETLIETEKIRKIKQRLLQNNPLGCTISGSGSAIYAVFAKKKSAEICLDNEKKFHENCCIVTPCCI